VKTILFIALGAVFACSPRVALAGRLGAIETVYVGNPGNAGELSGVGAGGFGADVIVGGVDYVYRMGKYEVTTGQYTEFLNAVARTDTYGLYKPFMGEPIALAGCNIQRTGAPGSYTYSVPTDWADRPVNYVSWGDAARYANWLHNGQPTGAQDLSTTEDGSYFLNGAIDNDELVAIVRESDATWVIPTESEWYKSAYHKNNGTTGDYWDYPMGSSDRPNNGVSEGDTGNTANFWDDGYAIGRPYWRTEAGHYGISESPYGTFDQGGNVWEWVETPVQGYYRGVRGGSAAEGSFGFGGGVYWLHAKSRLEDYPIGQNAALGFRVAHVPEPSVGAVFLLAALVIVAIRPKQTQRLRVV
jgi:formylglycine-generating enzyme required for sulfatase activity